jgi:hypothetical protein
MLAFVGLPLFYLEVAIGQYASLGPISIWRINPLFKGKSSAQFNIYEVISLPQSKILEILNISV